MKDSDKFKTGLAQYFPWIVLGIAGLFLSWNMFPPGTDKRFADFASLPVVDRGRIKPFDTLARSSMMIISGKQTYRDDDKKTHSAVKWLLDVMSGGPMLKNRVANDSKVFRIENLQVLAFLGLEPRPGSFRYSIAEIGDKIDDIILERKRITETVDPKKLTLYDHKIVELSDHLKIYLDIAHWKTPFAVPPLGGGGPAGWMPLLQGLQQKDKIAQVMQVMLQAYREGNQEEFNSIADAFQKALNKEMPQTMEAARFEVFFNYFAPFYKCIELYVFVFIFACLSWLGWSLPLRRAAFWLAVMTLAIHTIALIGRMYLQGRPPVTNLYSSAVFIGWGGVILGLFMEWIYKDAIGMAVGSALGALTLVIAHYLATSGDTLEMMQAVLDTNFWLATHVTCITLGYMATFVAGFLGVRYVITGVFTKALHGTEMQNLTKMIYGVVCFATLLSFTGTVLGGIWADQSWGRFWGWDPKENGALLIVIWNALILHARWGGIVKARGMALLAIAGNIVTAWSWFGVNMLGVGLHSYGFMSGAVFWLIAFMISQLVLIGLGSMPLRMWASFAAKPAGLPAIIKKPSLHPLDARAQDKYVPSEEFSVRK
jgi:ABC-type transport system involved in cytochrome c biogenesis permease subunit